MIQSYSAKRAEACGNVGQLDKRATKTTERYPSSIFYPNRESVSSVQFIQTFVTNCGREANAR